METWKWAPNSEGIYEVSNKGRIRSYKTGKSVILNCAPDPRGYVPVKLRGKVTKQYWLHRLVATLFVPNPQSRKEVNHKDGNKLNNCADNLEWVTRSQNIRHAYENGLIPTIGQRGSRNFNTKLTDDQVRAIRSLYNEREFSQPEIAKMYGISKGTVYRILNRHSWTHI